MLWQAETIVVYEIYVRVEHIYKFVYVCMHTLTQSCNISGYKLVFKRVLC